MKTFYTTLVVLLLLIAGNCHAAPGGSTTFEKLDMVQIILLLGSLSVLRYALREVDNSSLSFMGGIALILLVISRYFFRLSKRKNV